MSDMLEQAIVDAAALREAAIKNAETLVLEKYSNQIKDAVGSLLEQEDPLAAMAGIPAMAGGAPDPMATPGAADPMAMTPGDTPDPNDPTAAAASAPQSAVMEHIPMAATQKGGDIDKEIEIPLDALLEQIEKINLENEGKEEVELTEGLLEDLMAEDLYEEDLYEEEFDENKEIADLLGEDEIFEEEVYDEDVYEEDLFEEDLYEEELSEYVDLEEDYLEEDLYNQIYEQLTVDIHPQKSGWAGTPGPLLELADEELLALEQDSEVREEKEAIRKAVKELEVVNEALKLEKETLSGSLKEASDYIAKLKDTVLILKEKLDSTALSNAKLIYTNKALSSDSLNERQKQKLAEAISNADNIEEAKVIFETLQSTVGSTSRKNAKQPKSLSEAVEKTSSMILASRRKDSVDQKKEPAFDRWKFLAGIKKT